MLRPSQEDSRGQDIDAAVEGAIGSKFRNNGQTCVCANRIYVQAAVYDEFAARLVDAIRTMKVGDGFEDGVTFGPLIEQKAVEKVCASLRLGYHVMAQVK